MIIVSYRDHTGRDRFTEQFFDHPGARALMRRVNQSQHLVATRVEGSRIYFVGAGGGFYRQTGGAEGAVAL